MESREGETDRALAGEELSIPGQVSSKSHGASSGEVANRQ
jgi:hypothetical protein